VTNLIFRYGDGSFELRIPHLEVDTGERVACIGPSGCGKTTLLQLISGTLQPESGSITVDGLELSQLSESERRELRITRMGLVFQELELLDHLDLRENLLLPYLVNSSLTLDSEARERADTWIHDLGLQEHARRHPGRLSRGERQRVAVARSLIAHPDLLLADEPTGSLDPRTRRDVVELVLREARERGMTLLFVTHDHELLEAFDRVIDVSAWSSNLPTGAEG